MRKFRDCFVIEILREINFGENVEVLKLPFLPFFGL